MSSGGKRNQVTPKSNLSASIDMKSLNGSRAFPAINETEEPEFEHSSMEGGMNKLVSKSVNETSL